MNNIDPTGHCTEGADDFVECMEWVQRIQRRWDNVHVTTCIGSDAVANCKGWTADEVRLLYGALEHNPNDVSGTKLTFTRQGKFIDPRTHLPPPDFNVAADTDCTSVPGSCSLTFYDFAWNGGPSANSVDTELLYYTPSEGAFLGALVHELTHASISQDPSILDKWVSAHPKGDNRVGQNYSWGYLELYYYNDPAGLERARQEEMMAMSTAVDVTGWLDRDPLSPYQPPWYK